LPAAGPDPDHRNARFTGVAVNLSCNEHCRPGRVPAPHLKNRSQGMASPSSTGSIQSARHAGRESPPPLNAARKLIRLSRDLEEAVLLAMKYIAHATGAEPSQEELAAVLKSYFTLDEVTNQINYLRKKPPENAGLEAPFGLRRPTLRVNMLAAPQTNYLARAGYFVRPLADAIEAIRTHAKSMLGTAPSDANLAASLRSSFILSEIKNQIVHARKQRGQKQP
jgi:hypothetical protein